MSVWPQLKRWLVWLHRWAGVAGCLLFVVWFASGLVMVYVPYPTLTDSERLAGLPPLKPATVQVSPAAAVRVALGLPADDTARRGLVWPKDLRLSMLAERPAYQVGLWSGERRVVWADSGELAGPFDAAHAKRAAAAFTTATQERLAPAAARQAASERWPVDTLERDQWTVAQGLNPLRPLHRVATDGVAGLPVGTQLYVSAVSGEVVRDTHRWERAWNWVGSVPHWVYFTPLRADPPLWRSVVLWLSGFCIVSAVSGLVLGIWRLRPRRAAAGLALASPFKGWWAWHHWAGLLGGVLVVTWIISGWISMDPNRWFTAKQWPPKALQAMADAPPDWATLEQPALLKIRAVAQQGQGRELREITWRWVGGEAVMSLAPQSSAFTNPAASAAISAALAASQRPAELPVLPEGQVRRAVAALLAPHGVQQVQWLTEHDDYYYPHGLRERPLPVWRVVGADPAGTWVHVHPSSGAIVATVDDTARARRWWFNALHSLDFAALRQHQWLWLAVIWVGSTLGLVVSVSALVLAWRRVRHSLRSGLGGTLDTTPSFPSGKSAI